MATSPPPNPALRRIGARIRRNREQRDATLDDMALVSGVSARTLLNLENGRADARLSTLLALAEALGTTPAAFFVD